MDSLESLHDLFIEELKDLHSAETQLITALPILANATASEELRQLLQEHLKQTKEQLKRLDQLFKGLNASPEGKTCKAMAGLITEAKELLEFDAEPTVLDVGLIVAAQKIEHYEIAGYGSVRTFARVLGYNEVEKVLATTLAEESATDHKLTLAAEKLNAEARTADEAKE